jgi:hypothetical protein
LNFCLVAIQVSLSLLLLFGAGLFVRTLRNLESLGPGFPTDHLLTFTIDPSLNGYSDEEIKSFYERLNVNLQTMPGVTSVGFSSMPLLKAYAWQNAVLGKDFEGAPIEEQPVLSEVGPDYFATLGIPIVAGREFTAQDVGPAKYAHAPVRSACSGRWPGNHERTDWILAADRATGRQPFCDFRRTCHPNRRHRALRRHVSVSAVEKSPGHSPNARPKARC